MKSRNSILFLAALVFAAGTLFSRPMLFAQNLAPLSLLFFIAALLIAAFAAPLKISHRNLLIFILVLLYWVYVVVQSLLSGGNYIFASTGFVLVIGTLFCASIFLSNKIVHQFYFKICVAFIILQCASYILTVLFSLFVPLEQLLLVNFPVEGYLNAGRIYLPFTFVYGVLNAFGFTIPRLAAGFRESGMTQAFITWAYFTLPHTQQDRWYNRLILVIGLFGTLSTLAVPLFIFLSIYLAFARKRSHPVRTLGFLLSIPLILWLTYQIGYLLPDIGIQAKLSTGSIQDRWQVTSTALSNLLINPLGSGPFSGTEPLQGLNLVAWFGQIGVPGMILLSLVYLTTIWLNRFSYKKILLLLPLLLTWLISQPFYDSPLLFIWLLQLPSPVPRRIYSKAETPVMTSALPKALPGQ